MEDVQLTGSLVEKPQGLHSNTFRLSANARRMVRTNLMDRPQTGQITSLDVVTCSLMRALIGYRCGCRHDAGQIAR
jgi:hypothetical protein